MVKAITAASDDKALLAQANAVKRGLEKAMKDDVSPEVKKRYRRFAEDWSTEPKFVDKTKFSNRALVLLVFPDAKGEGPSPEWTFFWTDKGTKPHTITARRAPALRFRTGYKPKTRFRAVTGGPGVATGGWVRKFTVNHPGTEARKFSEKLLEDYKNEYHRTLDSAVSKAARRSRR